MGCRLLPGHGAQPELPQQDVLSAQLAPASRRHLTCASSSVYSGSASLQGSSRSVCPVLGMNARIESQHLHVDGNDDRWPSAASELKLLRNLAAVAKQREQPAEVC